MRRFSANLYRGVLGEVLIRTPVVRGTKGLRLYEIGKDVTLDLSDSGGTNIIFVLLFLGFLNDFRSIFS